MAEYRITHQTRYAYSQMVSLSQQLLHVEPRALPWQRLHGGSLYIQPHPQQQSEQQAEQASEPVDQTRAIIEAAGMDYDAIMSLPEDIRQEVIDQARLEHAQLTGASSGGGNSSSGGSAFTAESCGCASASIAGASSAS